MITIKYASYLKSLKGSIQIQVEWTNVNRMYYCFFIPCYSMGVFPLHVLLSTFHHKYYRECFEWRKTFCLNFLQMTGRRIIPSTWPGASLYTPSRFFGFWVISYHLDSSWFEIRLISLKPKLAISNGPTFFTVFSRETLCLCISHT